MELYRNEDIQAITDSLDKIVEETEIIKNNELEPTIEEYKQAIQIAKEFICSEKRIVYGGSAYNALIIDKDENDKIYKKYDRKDIEFYTPDPIGDLVSLCNIFQDRNFQFVQGYQARHEGTYTISVNFEVICDISYMPKNIFSNMPVKIIDNVMYSDPMWILVDILRQYNDPITSFWRLKDKTFFRANVLLKHYPLNLHTKHEFTYENKHEKLKRKLFDALSTIPSLIFMGSLAENYYSTLKSDICTKNIEVLSTNFKVDVKLINTLLQEIFKDKYEKLVIKFYRPFYQFWDERLEVYLDDEPIIKIYGNNGICLPYNNLYIDEKKIVKIQVGGFYKKVNFKHMKGGASDKCIKIGTFILLFNHLLIHRQYQYINRKETYKKYEKIMNDLLVKRKSFFKKEGKNVMDNTPFREFIIRCHGEAIDSNRKYKLQLLNKKLAGKLITFRYSPDIQRKNFTMPEYQFSNISGNVNENGLEKLLSSQKIDKNSIEK